MHQMPYANQIFKSLKHICLLAFIALFINACGASQYLGKGDKRFEMEQYDKAIEYYKQALKSSKSPGEVNFKIAESYRLSNRLAEAEPYYKAALDGGYRKEEAFYYYGMTLKANGKYEEALNQLQDYVSIGTNSRLKGLAAREVENFGQLSDIMRGRQAYEVQNLQALNTEASEFGPYILNNDLVFSSTRGPGKAYMGNGEGFIDIYATTLTDSVGEMGGAVRKFENVNIEGLHDALATFANEGRTMVFARGNEGKKKGRQNVDLFVTYFRSNAWTEPKLLTINDARAWDSSPAFSPDGKTLYFSSDRKGGLGGNDIYRVELDENNRFGSPENLGPDINTPGNESFVHVSPDGTLYIASDGLPGLGNLDLFRVDNGKPVNMGTPVNSPGDDFSIYFQSTTRGFFSSNREGGKGGDDLYSLVKSQRKLVNFYVDGTVYLRREKDKKQTIVPNQLVVLQNDKGQKIKETTSDAEGKFSFSLDTASTYSLVSEKAGFFTARTRVTTVGKIPAQDKLLEDVNDIRLTATLVLNEIVKEKAIVLENIFYDFDKADIRPDAAIELDKLVEVLNDNPNISIELSSHTDVRGSDVYNQDLSQRRAESAVEYIISKGIDRSRITAKGYGESRLVVKNAKTDAEHQRNRRTEFKVVRIKE
ncbi:OmpA family protein [Pontibacter sp. KCTC 32443]|uniref:OmpA family protein n=1 Tax=Pontibacter TaxID=323449 RepID=UPI00164DF3C3|nr:MULTISPECIES: OmpA family protein [Pontibacter]MBC5774502.1 OmpA family protein [Pontibacter sp. KCTC 32443]